MILARILPATLCIVYGQASSICHRNQTLMLCWESSMSSEYSARETGILYSVQNTALNLFSHDTQSFICSASISSLQSKEIISPAGQLCYQSDLYLNPDYFKGVCLALCPGKMLKALIYWEVWHRLTCTFSTCSRELSPEMTQSHRWVLRNQDFPGLCSKYKLTFLPLQDPCRGDSLQGFCISSEIAKPFYFLPLKKSPNK